MSKMKLSFSLILTIILVGILSTAAFARGAYWEGIKADGSGGFNFQFVNTDAAAKDFTVKVYTEDETTGDFTVFQFESAALNAPSVPSPSYADLQTINIAKTDVPGDVQIGTIYKFELNDSTGPIGVKYGVLTDSANLAMASMADDPNSLLDLDGSKLANANHTGMNENVYRRTGQKTHGFYQNNTNSCAGCHQTHTGADDNLLMKDGVYSTCSACHDGTTGAYNSFAPITEETAHSISGTFGVDSTHNGSIHQADGSLKVAAAPGGNVDINSKEFGQEFDCASCHSPHGNGSLSENNLNLDPLGWGSVAYGTTGDAQYGRLFTIGTVYTEGVDVPTTKGDPFILVKRTVTVADIRADYFYNRSIDTTNMLDTDTVDIIQTYAWKNENHATKYQPDYSLWLREKGYPYKADTVLKDATDADIPTTDLTVVWKDGFAYGPGVANIDHATLSIGIDVETTDNIASLYDDADANYVPDSGYQMSQYCSSCHTDYLSLTRRDVTGKYTTAHRHQTATDELTCVRCHFGHGSEAKIMKDANDNTYYDLTTTLGLTDTAAIDYLKDPNPSSALKRYTGMAVCYACHGKGEQFLGNQQNGQDATTGQYLKDGQPGTTRTDIIYNNN